MAPADSTSRIFSFDNSYARLQGQFYTNTNPTPVAAPSLVKVNHALARHLGLDPEVLESDEGVSILAGNSIPDGASPIAMAYAGHQFGGWSPQLGDGRAVLLGEVIDMDGIRRDIQLKGSGRTPFSRMGDGRAWLGPVIREYVVSEAMAALGIPTTRALAAAKTGEAVLRERPYPGAVLTRVASSHIRVGTFQFFAARQDDDALMRLADYAIDRHYPVLEKAENPYLALLEQVVERQANLVARWMLVGFIHGVMNTDNMTISGETIDYGPCAFMDVYHPGKVFSSIDQNGRYAFSNQPSIAQWNLAQLATALLPLIDADQDKAVELATDAINTFATYFNPVWAQGLAAKIGLQTEEDDDFSLIQDLLKRMTEGKADFTLTFRRLADLPALPEPQPEARDHAVRSLFSEPTLFDGWAENWRNRLAREPEGDVTRSAFMKSVNPAYTPRNHRVEEAIQAAVRNDFEPFNTLVNVLANPFDDQPDKTIYQQPPQPEEEVTETFCGT